MIFGKKKKLNSDEYGELRRRIDMLDLDISLLTDKLQKAISRKAIKKEPEPEEPEEDKNKNPQMLPI